MSDDLLDNKEPLTLEQEAALSADYAQWLGRRQERLNRLADFKKATRELLARLDEMEGPLNSVCVLADVHGMPYSGPTWEIPVANLRALLAAEAGKETDVHAS